MMDSPKHLPLDPVAPGKVSIEESPGVLRLILDNEPARNALTSPMLQEIADTLTTKIREDIRAVVITGAGTAAFCSGANLQALQDRVSTENLTDQIRDTFALLGSCKVPTIARITGACIGAGLELALTCDLRVCSPESLFSLPAARLGVSYPADGLRRFVEKVGLSNATRIALLGERISADDAYAMGLVHHQASDPDDLVATWIALLKGNHSTAVSTMKRTLRACS